jgi:HlyD family secretion protein
MKPRAWIAVALLALAHPLSASDSLRLEGEIFARKSAPLMPPAVDSIWQFSITRITPDGVAVTRGEPVLAFEGGEVQRRLMEKMSALAEKQRAQEKLLLELAEREKSERLASEERRAQRDKAQRKASQPESLLGRVDYRKLVAERRHAEHALELAERREHLAAAQRVAEQRLVDAEVQQLQAEVAMLQAAIASLQLTAPRDGIMLHRSDWQGNKLDVGSQVWRGQTVAEVPDLTSLAVRALLPEHQYQRLAEGAAARVTVEGGGQVLAGRVVEIGRIVRSRSRLQPVPVIDVIVALDGASERLKPGQAVRVEIADVPPAQQAAGGAR